MKGYKAFDANMQCRCKQYAVGKTYKEDGCRLRRYGMHFCTDIADCFIYYGRGDDRLAEVEAIGEVIQGDGIAVTDEIRIIREIPRSEAVGMTCAGSANTDCWNEGSWNTGRYNAGDHNTGDENAGNYNTGLHNTGCFNAGDYNTGDYNTGNSNKGICNAGDFNAGSHNAGCFCTETPKMMFFDRMSDWTFEDWENSWARHLLRSMPAGSVWIKKEDMTAAEKQENPAYKKVGGYLKEETDLSGQRQIWWNRLADDDKQVIRSLPNFDDEKFRACTGICTKKTSS